MNHRPHRRLTLLSLALLLIGLLTLRPEEVSAQPVIWARLFGSQAHDAALSVTVDKAGAAYVAGWTDGALPGQSSAGARDAFVRKYSAVGAPLWTRQFGTSKVDVALDVAVDEAGAVYVAGQTGGALTGQSSTGAFDAFVRKYDAGGTEVWTRQFGASGAGPAASAAVADLEPDPQGNIFLAGWVYGALPGQSWSGLHDSFVRKYSATGQESWTRQAGTAAQDSRRSGDQAHDLGLRLAVDAAGGVYAAGFADGNRTVVRRYSATGAAISSITIEPGDEGTRRIPQVDAAGNVYVIGSDGFDHGEAFVRKYDPTGKPVWTDNLGHSDTISLSDVVIDRAGNVYVPGISRTSPTQRTPLEPFIHRHAANETKSIVRGLGATGSLMTTRLRTDEAGGVYLVGWTSRGFAGLTIGGPSDAFVIKVGAF